jgi:hypothetical protein
VSQEIVASADVAKRQLAFNGRKIYQFGGKTILLARRNHFE